MQALAAVAACGAAGGLCSKAAGKSREPAPELAPWLTLPPTPALPRPDKSGLAAINGTQLFYAQFGQGTPVLLLHGGLANSSYWGHQIEYLAKNHLVTVADTRGHGRSPVTSSSFGYEVFADDVIALIEFLHLPKVSLIGWSDGAVTGLLVAMRKPELVARLFAFGANVSLDGMKAGGGRTPVFAAYSTRCKAEYRALSPDPDKWSKLVDGLRAMWHSELHITKRKLAAIKSSTTISVGQYDEIIRPEHAQEMARAIPGARLVIQLDVSHFAMLQNPDQFNRALAEFLAA